MRHEPTPIETFSFNDLADGDYPPPGWLIEPILPVGDLFILAGPPKKGKSWFALDMAASLAYGEPFIGLPVPAARSVLFCNFEDGLSVTANRVKVRRTPGKTMEARFEIVLAPGDSMGAFNAFVAEAVRSWLPALIVIDPLAELLRHLPEGAENDSAVMSNLLRPMRELAQASGVTILVVHHRRRAGADANGNAMRGSSAIQSATAGDISFAGSTERATVLTTFRMARSNSWRIRFNGETGRWVCVDEEGRPRTLAARVLDHLETNAYADYRSLEAALGATRGALAPAVAQLVRDGKVRREENGTTASFRRA